MSIQRTPITVGDGEWGPYNTAKFDGATVTLDTNSGLASLSGVFKALSGDYPLSPNTGMQCGYIDRVANPELVPASGVRPAGVASVRIGSTWYPALAWLDTTTGGASVPLVIQAAASGVITECAVSIPPYKTINAV